MKEKLNIITVVEATYLVFSYAQNLINESQTVPNISRTVTLKNVILETYVVLLIQFCKASNGQSSEMI